MSRSHGVSATTEIEPATAEEIARVMAGLATASRVRILGRLRLGPCTVGELCSAVAMAQPAVSHQLRILRDLRLVVGVRDGRHTVYGLYDPHVAELLDEALRHVAHLRAGAPDLPRLALRLPLPASRHAHGSDQQPAPAQTGLPTSPRLQTQLPDDPRSHNGRTR